VKSGRVGVLRRLDVGARAALLASGLLAQWAMWMVAPSWVYPAAALVLIALSVESARRPFVAPVGARFGAGSSRRRRNAYRIVACVALVDVCVGIVGSVPVAGAVPMAVPLGVLLLTVQGAQVATIESRRDAIVGLFVVVGMLADAGFFARNARPAVPITSSAVMLLIAAALLQRGSVLARTRAAVAMPAAAVSRTLLIPVTTAVVIGAIAFLAMPNSLQLGTRAVVGQVSVGGDGTGAAMEGRAALDPGASSLDLRVRGDLSDQPVFAVAASSPPYWQGSIFDTFDGTRWTATGAAGGAVSGAATGAATATAQLVAAAQPVRTDSVRVLSPGGLDEVVAPGAPSAYSGPGQMVVGADGNASLTSAGATAPWTYQVSSTTATGGPTALRAATGSDPNDLKWTAVEPGLPARVRELATQLTASAATRYDAVSAVDSYLQAHETYDLTAPVPAPGQDAVDDFLFVSHRGFCEQFASAAVIMLRSTGIPARLVTGYSQGDLASEPGERVMRGADAHAWIQVWYSGVGWVASDPTASAVLPAAPMPAATTGAPQRQPVHLATAMQMMPGGRVGWLVALVGATALAGCGAWVAGVMRRRRPGPTRPTPADPRPGDGPILRAYVRLDAVMGGYGRAPAETLRDVAHHLDAAACTPAEVAIALDCLERECYAIVPPAVSEVEVAVDVFDRLRAFVSGGVLLT